MKRLIILLAIALLATGCAASDPFAVLPEDNESLNSSEQLTSIEPSSNAEISSEDVENYVELILRSEGEAIGKLPELTAEQLGQGYKSVRYAENGDLVFTMTEECRTRLLTISVGKMEDSFNEIFKLVSSYPITDIKLSAVGDKATLYVDKEKFEKGDYSKSINSVCEKYASVHDFYGKKREDATFTVELVNNLTSEVYKTVTYPTDIDSLFGTKDHAKEPAPSAALSKEPVSSTPPVKETTWKSPGMYKVGSDIKAGEYIIRTNDSCYYSVSTDSSGSLESIVQNDNFKGYAYVTVADGQYLEISRGEFIDVASAPILSATSGEGMYKVGRDIKAGEYKVSAVESGYVAVLTSSKGGIDSIVTNDNFTGEKYITVADGQYLEMSRCKIIS